MSATVYEIFKSGKKMLEDGGIADADFDSRQLIYFVCGYDPTSFALNCFSECSDDLAEKYFALIDRRLTGEPLQYIIGRWDFCDRSFFVGKGVLIPRPETEEMTVLCINEIKKRGYKTVFDLCSGSGCIGISIACECAETDVYLVEKYSEALSYIKNNIPAEISERVHIIQADLFDGPGAGLPDTDIIVSNPPYIPSGETDLLSREVKQEPLIALDGGNDGLDFYMAISKKWYDSLKKGGMAIMECGENQAEPVREMFVGCKSRIIKDFYGTERFVLIEKLS